MQMQKEHTTLICGVKVLRKNINASYRPNASPLAFFLPLPPTLLDPRARETVEPNRICSRDPLFLSSKMIATCMVSAFFLEFWNRKERSGDRASRLATDEGPTTLEM